MARRVRRTHNPAFKAKVALAHFIHRIEAQAVS